VVDRETAPGAVVVGVDGSATDTAAVRWAVEEAHRRPARLCVVHALSQRHSGAFQRANPAFVAEERRTADEVLCSAIRQARVLGGDVDVHPVLEAGRPAVVLLRRAVAAALVVLGSTGRGGFAALLLGSTSLQVAMHASCPVVVLRDHATGAGPASGRIVVGTDGSPTSDSALRFAFARARRDGRSLTVVRAWGSAAIVVDVPGSAKWEQVEKEEQATLSEALVPWRDRYPEVDVLEKSVLGNAAALLVDESAAAELLVVGSRGRGGFGGLLLGSASHAALHHAHCPVAVVRR
jgi:nucleotide-binding universal stress UspA family protein